MATVVANLKDTVEYARSCNPPRRAKRPRHDDIDAPPVVAPTATAPQAPPQRAPPAHILPRDSNTHPKVHDGESSEEGEEDYDPSEPAPAPKRRGRKPGAMSRSARESQRKLNHSRIEKARRTKINETLSTLSDLVNDAEREKLAAGGHVARVEDEGAKGKGKQGEKEFKLDVLVKAVSYVQELLEKVKTLESQRCTHCSSGASTPGKRKRGIADEDADIDADIIGDGDDVYVGDDERGAYDQDDEDDEPRARPPSSSSRYSSVHPTPSPRLPPIASWLPHPYVDPSCIGHVSEGANATQSSHYPSPPMSGSFRSAAAQSLHTLPSLTLPGPARPSSGGTKDASQSKPTFDNRRMSLTQPPHASRVSASPSVSPTWTPDDETAATMLLQMSSSPRASKSSASAVGITSLKLPQPAEASQRRRQSVSSSPLYMQVQTPSSMLGM
ncbi:hypothetical protein EUX98_g2362 [Antrodiella citrinella]|uniref:BHLH domain-containing protein n=1 Tax=Antrodiella citrinella TaxID=2447956 RepID=A0A4S4N7F1_9APHY|nr:hypothetical protein EUX98_g2362 [Antrodiella citrinella]